QCIIGSTRTFSGFDRSASRAGVAAIVGEAVRRVPRLAGARIWRSFAGLRPFVPDKKPIIGRSVRVANVLVATGHEGDGITRAPAPRWCASAAPASRSITASTTYRPRDWGRGKPRPYYAVASASVTTSARRRMPSVTVAGGTSEKLRRSVFLPPWSVKNAEPG